MAGDSRSSNIHKAWVFPPGAADVPLEPLFPPGVRVQMQQENGVLREVWAPSSPLKLIFQVDK